MYSRFFARQNPRTSEERYQDALRSSIRARESASHGRYATESAEAVLPWGWLAVATVAGVALVALNRTAPAVA